METINFEYNIFLVYSSSLSFLVRYSVHISHHAPSAHSLAIKLLISLSFSYLTPSPWELIFRGWLIAAVDE